IVESRALASAQFGEELDRAWSRSDVQPEVWRVVDLPPGAPHILAVVPELLRRVVPCGRRLALELVDAGQVDELLAERGVEVREDAVDVQSEVNRSCAHERISMYARITSA